MRCAALSAQPAFPLEHKSTIASPHLPGIFSAMTVQDIETAVTQLPKEELARFSQWFEEYLADQWDRQIEADIRAGRFEAAGKRAKADYEAGRCTPL